MKQYTKRSDYWNTPSKLYDYVINYLGYLDYNPSNSMISPFDNNVGYFKNSKVFINPPFSILSKIEFIDTIDKLVENNNDVLLLIPSRTDTQYFHKLLELKPKITYIKGRLNFNDEGSAPFPSLFLEFDRLKKYENHVFDYSIFKKERKK